MMGPAHSVVSSIVFGAGFFGIAIGLIVLGLWLHGRASKKDGAQ